MSTVRFIQAAVCSFFITVSAQQLMGQDKRTVPEPSIPPTCSTVSAQLAIVAGEPSSETVFDTSRIQTALNACPSGNAVELVAAGSSTAFLIQPITIPTGVTLLVDGGTTVFASRNPADYQIGTVSATQEACGTVGTLGNGCGPLIKSTGTTGSGVMGYGIINGRGGDNLLVKGVVQTYSWYSNTLQAYAASPVKAQNNPDLISAQTANNFTVYKITLTNSPHYNIHWAGQNGVASATSGLTVWGIRIIAPYNIPNTDGVDAADNATNVTISNTTISIGDTQVNFSSHSAGYPVSNVSLFNIQTFSGRGIAVGPYTTGGVSNVFANLLTMAGNVTDPNSAGLRVESAADRGGAINNVTFQNVCEKNMVNPIRISPFYTTTPANTSSIPTFTNIAIRNATITAGQEPGPGTLTLQGYDASHITGLTLDNVTVSGVPNITANPPQDVAISIGPGAVNPPQLQQLTGPGVTETIAITNPTEASYSCPDFEPISNAMFISTPTATNLQNATVSTATPVTLNVVLQPTSAEFPALLNPVTFYDGITPVGTAALMGNGTLASVTIPSLTAGVHTYSALYRTDGYYSNYSFGYLVVTANPSLVNPATLNIVSGNSQTGVSGSVLPIKLTVKVTGSDGNPYAGALVTFAVASGSATLSPSTPQTTAADGTASTTVTLGSTGGPITVTASVPGVTPATFSLTSTTNAGPQIFSGGVTSAGLSTPAVLVASPNAILSIFGQNFAPVGTSHAVSSMDLVNGAIPTNLSGVCVTIGNTPAPIFYVSPGQLNIQAPQVPSSGTVSVQVITNCGTTPLQTTSNSVMVSVAASAPEFFYSFYGAAGANSIAAVAPNGSAIGNPARIGQGFALAYPGEVIQAFATGLGLTNPAFAPGQLPTSVGQVTGLTVSIDGVPLSAAAIQYAGVAPLNAGLYQLNIALPTTITPGDHTIVMTLNGATSPAAAYISVGSTPQ